MYSCKLKLWLATIAAREVNYRYSSNKRERWMKKREAKDDGLGERGERKIRDEGEYQ
jgi:hypothetical protein